jgi:hypothetical protein
VCNSVLGDFIMNVRFLDTVCRLAVTHLLVLLVLISQVPFANGQSNQINSYPFGTTLTEDDLALIQQHQAELNLSSNRDVLHNAIIDPGQFADTIQATSMGITAASTSVSPHVSLGGKTEMRVPWNVEWFGCGQSYLYLSCKDLCGHGHSDGLDDVISTELASIIIDEMFGNILDLSDEFTFYGYLMMAININNMSKAISNGRNMCEGYGVIIPRIHVVDSFLHIPDPFGTAIWDDTGVKRQKGPNQTLTFNANGGNGSQTRTLRAGQQIGTLPTPHRYLYTFVGWFDTSNLTGGNQYTATDRIGVALLGETSVQIVVGRFGNQFHT